ncbi:ankyrin repeat containing protein [Diaporthe amygdali]|uniref:ankyrin repeat containing protein n=1 Tax=Phomopsis amygdali TaxID=1214568 RepID=UPI0022FDB8C7|nr:ankyrin repeat containing protein [Diaporthe amygdali]KAJ0109490.1 ankyrin repeat containing protein [Diaporthe amygdali]
MDTHISREFAVSLLAACEGDEETTIAPQCLTEPKFLATFSDFLGNILKDWTTLPPQLRTTFQNTFSANGWHLSFERDVASWIKSEIDSSLAPQEDTATRLFGHLRRLSKPTTPLQTVMRQIYLVEFHHLRQTFNTRFTSLTREPLATYIGKRLDLEATEVRSVYKYLAQAEKRVQKGPEFDDVIQLLKDRGLVRNEGTELYYNLADEFISRRRDEGTCLVDKICGNSRSRRRPTTRIKIESLGIEPTTPTAVGSWSSPSAGQHLDRAGVSMPQGVLQNIACGVSLVSKTFRSRGSSVRPPLKKPLVNITILPWMIFIGP